MIIRHKRKQEGARELLLKRLYFCALSLFGKQGVELISGSLVRRLESMAVNIHRCGDIPVTQPVIARTQEKIERYKETIQLYEQNVSASKMEEAKANNQQMLDSYKKQLAETEQKLIDLGKQKAELESK